jgi:mannose-6-phosphate isomerase-like protein (cupin superfamily)
MTDGSNEPTASWQTTRLRQEYDTLAPDGSEIRFLATVSAGSTVHCTLPPGGVTQAVRHRTVEESWFFLSGEGEVWRRQGTVEEITPVGAGIALTIPLGTDFQFRTLGKEPLVFVITTMPPWPGPDEAIAVSGRWSEHIGG